MMQNPYHTPHVLLWWGEENASGPLDVTLRVVRGYYMGVLSTSAQTNFYNKNFPNLPLLLARMRKNMRNTRYSSVLMSYMSVCRYQTNDTSGKDRRQP